MSYKNKAEEQLAVHAIIEAGELFTKKGNTLTLDFSLAKRIWKEVASVIGKQNAAKISKKKHKEYGMLGAEKRWKK